MKIADLLLSFTGRINRGKLWLGVLLLFIFSLAGYVAIVALLGHPFIVADPEAINNGADPVVWGSPAAVIGYAALSMFSMYMYFALMAKRCHDRGKSGWWSLISLIPIVGAIWFIIDLGIMEGDEGPSQYGPNPLKV